MKVFYSPTSPYARKVRVTALESGLYAQITWQSVDPWSDASLRLSNPLGKIPALMLDDGSSLYDSRVICEYLDARASSGLFPAGGEARWQALRLQALGDGICDAAVRWLLESRRAPEVQARDVMERQLVAIDTALDALERQSQTLTMTTPSIGEFACACALSYLDLRQPHRDWRATRPQLAAWHAQISARPSMQQTQPPA